jgi:hypothetical protein
MLLPRWALARGLSVAMTVCDIVSSATASELDHRGMPRIITPRGRVVASDDVALTNGLLWFVTAPRCRALCSEHSPWRYIFSVPSLIALNYTYTCYFRFQGRRSLNYKVSSEYDPGDLSKMKEHRSEVDFHRIR